MIELTAGEVSYGPVEASALDFSPPSDAKVVEVGGEGKEAPGTKPDTGQHPKAPPTGTARAAWR